MSRLILTAVITIGDDNMYVINCPELNITTEGHNLDDALYMIRDAVELTLESKVEDGEDIEFNEVITTTFEVNMSGIDAPVKSKTIVPLIVNSENKLVLWVEIIENNVNICDYFGKRTNVSHSMNTLQTDPNYWGVYISIWLNANEKHVKDSIKLLSSRIEVSNGRYFFK